MTPSSEKRPLSTTRRLAFLCVAGLLWAGSLTIGACDGGGAEARPVGGRGFPCFFDRDCAEPTICERTSASEFPLCTGTVLEGLACTDSEQCVWIRDSRGLPLACSADGRCRFPGDGPTAP